MPKGILDLNFYVSCVLKKKTVLMLEWNKKTEKKSKNYKFRNFYISSKDELQIQKWFTALNTAIVNIHSNLSQDKPIATFIRSFDSLISDKNDRLKMMNNIDFNSICVHPFDGSEKTISLSKDRNQTLEKIFQYQNEMLSDPQNAEILAKKITDLSLLLK